MTETGKDLFVRIDPDGYKVVLIIPKPPYPATVSIQNDNDAIVMTYADTVIDALEEAGLVRRVETA